MADINWREFVQGKTVAAADEEGEWNVLRFTDGTSFHFTSDDAFVMVEANPQ